MNAHRSACMSVNVVAKVDWEVETNNSCVEFDCIHFNTTSNCIEAWYPIGKPEKLEVCIIPIITS